jgi:hypothetical protein
MQKHISKSIQWKFQANWTFGSDFIDDGLLAVHFVSKCAILDASTILKKVQKKKLFLILHNNSALSVWRNLLHWQRYRRFSINRFILSKYMKMKIFIFSRFMTLFLPKNHIWSEKKSVFHAPLPPLTEICATPTDYIIRPKELKCWLPNSFVPT